mmetsp:Transcript_25465/g.28494  ORF Transcript_25465/g.28494 Transcript_25465/m.28494 type:complete len:82 (+) Transcript_25465:251-496(+)
MPTKPIYPHFPPDQLVLHKKMPLGPDLLGHGGSGEVFLFPLQSIKSTLRDHITSTHLITKSQIQLTEASPSGVHIGNKYQK